VSAHNDSFLGLELIELANALDSVRLLADCERAGCLPGTGEMRQVSRATSATINLIGERLRQLGGQLASQAEETSRGAVAASAAVRRPAAGGRRGAGAPRGRRRGRPPARSELRR
jgi:hypothetical protein